MFGVRERVRVRDFVTGRVTGRDMVWVKDMVRVWDRAWC